MISNRAKHLPAALLLLAFFLILPAPAADAAATRSQIKLVRGTWYKNSSGFAKYSYTFTNKYCLTHKKGKIVAKDKIVSVKKSGNRYTFYMKSKGYKYHYVGERKKGQIKELWFHWNEDGETHYSGSSSMTKEKPPFAE